MDNSGVMMSMTMGVLMYMLMLVWVCSMAMMMRVRGRSANRVPGMSTRWTQRAADMTTRQTRSTDGICLGTGGCLYVLAGQRDFNRATRSCSVGIVSGDR